MFATVSDALLRGHTLALAAVGDGITGKMVDGVCQLIGPFVGSDSKVLSLVFLIVMGGFMLMWYLNESKEGVVVVVLRTGVVLGVLINIFSLPSLFGLPGICGG